MKLTKNTIKFLFNFFILSCFGLDINPKDFVYKKISFVGNYNHTIEILEYNCIELIKDMDFQLAYVLESALQELMQTDQSFSNLLNSICIKRAFAFDVDLLPKPVVQQVQMAQYFIVLRLYKILFEQYIKSAKTELNDLVIARNYWKQEAFFLAMPASKKPWAYLAYSDTYKNTIFKNVKVLHNLENQMAYILGVCLYGFDYLDKLESIDGIETAIQDAIKPLYEHYTVVVSVQDPVQIFRDMGYLQERMQLQIQEFKQLLSLYQKPNFFVDHAYSLTTGVALSAILACLCYKNSDAVSDLLSKTTQTCRDFFQNYVQEPSLQLNMNFYTNIHAILRILFKNFGFFYLCIFQRFFHDISLLFF